MSDILRIAYCLSLFAILSATHHGFAQTKIVTAGQFQSLESLDGVTLIPPLYEKIGWSNGLNLPVDGVIGYFDKGWGLVTIKNKPLTPSKYYSLEAIHKDLILASIKGKFSNELFYGALNSKGQVIIDFKYHSLHSVQNLLIAAKRNTNSLDYGLLNENNQTLLPFKYKAIELISPQLFKLDGVNNKSGIATRSGQILLAPTLDSIAPFDHEVARVFQQGKIGLLSAAGMLIHEPLYKSIDENRKTQNFDRFNLVNHTGAIIKSYACDSILELSKDLLVVISNHHFQVFNMEHHLIFETNDVDEMIAFRKNFVFKRKGKHYFIKYNGESIAPQGFDSLMYDQSYIYGLRGDEWQIYNKYGSLITEKKYKAVRPKSNNLIAVQKNSYWGYLDHSGQVAIPIKFNEASPFQANIAKVNYLGFNHIINQFGEVVGDQSYDEITIGQQNIAVAKHKSRTDLINNHGEIYFQTFNTLSKHPFGHIETTADQKYGVISHFGDVILNPIYDSISAVMHKHFLVVRKGDQIGLVHFKGRWIIPLTDQYQSIAHVGAEYIGIQKNDQFGFVDHAQRLLIANRYDSVQAFSEHRAAIQLHAKWGFIDKKEKLMVQPNYDAVLPFHQGASLVKREGKWGAINLQGQVLIGCGLDKIERTAEGYFLTEKEGKLGLSNNKGETLLANAYDQIRSTPQGSYIVSRRGLTGVLDSSGSYAIPLKYEQINPISKKRFICKLSASD